ncbi:uncharacterized protein C8A04DRAFT_29669 [Dichotomopilus funicola]|uniref:Uncharacterized protein n=1 Tax=Dichotomopilus funicola TaxID=1934379 RepID=A0AAN6V0P3_9PEZI|nr:hypothetical protein C8A04DRAFT_29669 [Dichotomopilus funicola]
MARKQKTIPIRRKAAVPAADAAAVAAAQPATPLPSTRPTFPPGDARSVLSAIRWGSQKGGGLERPPYPPNLAPWSSPLAARSQSKSQNGKHIATEKNKRGGHSKRPVPVDDDDEDDDQENDEPQFLQVKRRLYPVKDLISPSPSKRRALVTSPVLSQPQIPADNQPGGSSHNAPGTSYAGHNNTGGAVGSTTNTAADKTTSKNVDNTTCGQDFPMNPRMANFMAEYNVPGRAKPSVPTDGKETHVAPSRSNNNNNNSGNSNKFGYHGRKNNNNPAPQGSD